MTVLEVESCVATREPIGEGAQGTRRFVASHGPAVAARQHGRLEPSELRNRLLDHPPAPARVPRRPREAWPLQQ